MLRASPEGIQVRNLRTTWISWSDVQAIRVEDQTPYRAGWAGFLGSLMVRPVTGVVVHRHDGSAVASSALQGTSPFWIFGRTRPDWLRDLAAQVNDMIPPTTGR
jgi:hypothetical protein